MTRARETADLLTAQEVTGNINLSGIVSTGNLYVGSGSTILGDGTIRISGALHADGGIFTPTEIEAFDPFDGQTNVSSTLNKIIVQFNKPIGIGSTGYIYIQSPTTTIQTISVGSTAISRTNEYKNLEISLDQELAKGVVGAANTITTVIDADFIDDPLFVGVNTTGSSVEYSFEIETVALGSLYEGGYFICYGGGVQWIVSEYAAEVSRTWACRNDAVGVSSACSGGCADFFVPTCAQQINPGLICKTYWDNFSNSLYWSSTQSSPNAVYVVCMQNDQCFTRGINYTNPIGFPNTNQNVHCVRAFRCVTY